MIGLRGLKFDIRWEQLKLLPDGEKILEYMIDDYLWIKKRDVTKEEMVSMIESDPIKAEVVVYGIHGLMVSMESGSHYWNVFTLEHFEPILKPYIHLANKHDYDKDYIDIKEKLVVENESVKYLFNNITEMEGSLKDDAGSFQKRLCEIGIINENEYDILKELEVLF